MSRIQIFSRDGYRLTEAIADADRSWLISKFGRCAFTIPVISAICKAQYLQFGNFVMIEHPKLPAWGGMIDTPRKWGNNEVTISAYTPEYILNFRTMGYDNLTLTEGGLYAHAIDLANKVDATRLFKAAPIDATGAVVSYALCYEKIYEYLRDKLTYEWRIVPVVESNRIHFEASLYEKFIRPLDFTLSEGINIELGEDTLTEDGFIYNNYTGIGKGSSWGSRVKYFDNDAESGSKYSYREGALQVDSKDVATVEEATKKQLKKAKQPEKAFDISVVDDSDTNAFKYLDCGNVLHVNLSVCGFNGDGLGTTADVRITGMTFLENKGVVRLICEEYSDNP